jgi:hypothetical protein
MTEEKELTKCPHCGQEIFAKALKCKHCKQFINGDPAVLQEQVLETYPEEKGFFGSLFDFSLTEMITPRIIRFIFAIGLLVLLLGTVFGLVSAILTGELVAIIVAVVVLTVGFFLAAIMLRVYMELIVVFFRIYDELRYSNEK